MRWKGRVVLEMGRAFAASCGTYLTRAEDIKKNNGKNICLTDGGIHQLQYDGQIRGMYIQKSGFCRKYREDKRSGIYTALCVRSTTCSFRGFPYRE